MAPVREEQRLTRRLVIGPQAGRTAALRLLPRRLPDDSRHRGVKGAVGLGPWRLDTVEHQELGGRHLRNAD
jgi:hypothetical protein